MKKKIGIISTLIVMILVVILAILITNKKENEPLNFITNGSNIAYMYEKEDGGYEQGTSNAWSTGEYVLDIEDSSCNGDEDPVDVIDWDPSSNGVLLSSNKNINSTLYFDKKSEQEKFFEKLLGPSGDGELLYHNSFFTNGANDHGYRYSGDDPNNFICFGPGSESYNGSAGTCADKNLYRIIGYVPVTLSNGIKTKLIKVIKSEYATADDLGKTTADGTAWFNKDYEDLIRVKKVENIDGFRWNDDEYVNIWGNSTLYEKLNDSDSGYLNRLTDWAEKIVDVQWNVGGYDVEEPPIAKEMYNIENSAEYGKSTKENAKIGLIYIYDYGFASSKENWTKLLGWDSGNNGYSNDENRKNNWLFNGVSEWTISRFSFEDDDAFIISSSGNVDGDNWVYGLEAIRPVFYLNSDVKITADNGIDGSENKPYRIN